MLSSSPLWNYEGGPGVERVRLPVLERFSTSGIALCDLLLVRGCARGCEVIADLFDADCLNDTTCLHNQRLGFSLYEPAVNVYQAGGCFDRHEDKQTLTILIPLSSPDAFAGGGTAFFDGSVSAFTAAGTPTEPAMVLKPTAGTALLFCGSVSHAGQPALSGERCIFVASFSPWTQLVTKADEGIADDSRQSEPTRPDEDAPALASALPNIIVLSIRMEITHEESVHEFNYECVDVHKPLTCV